MENNERKPGESIKQWRDRIKAQNRIKRVKDGKDYGGELESAIVIADGPQTMQQKVNTTFNVKLPEMFRAKGYRPSKFSFEDAYKDARSKGQRTFFYGTKYFNTDYEGEHGKQYKQDLKSGKVAGWERQYPNFTYPELVKEKEEELATYGITDEQTQNKGVKARLLKKVPARGYDVSNAISAILGEHNSFDQYDSAEEALQAIHKKYGNRFLDAPVDTLGSNLYRDGGLDIRDRRKESEYRESLSEEDEKLYEAFRNDVLAYGGVSSNKEIHRGEYNLLLGYPVPKDAGIKPSISRYKTGTLPYYYSTPLLESSRPFIPSYINSKINERRAQEQRGHEQRDSLYSLFPKLPENLTVEEYLEARKNDPVVQRLDPQLDSIENLFTKDGDKFAEEVYSNPDLSAYGPDRGVWIIEGGPAIDQSKFIQNASKDDIDTMFRTGAITQLNNTWFQNISPGNHSANTGNENYYFYSKEYPVSDRRVGKYDDYIKKFLSWVEKRRGADVGGANLVPAINTEFFGIKSEPSLGTYTLSVPTDKSFISVYDKFDIDPFGSGNDKPIIPVGRPFEYYTRFYPEGKTPNIDSLYTEFNKNGPK